MMTMVRTRSRSSRWIPLMSPGRSAWPLCIDGQSIHRKSRRLQLTSRAPCNWQTDEQVLGKLEAFEMDGKFADAPRRKGCQDSAYLLLSDSSFPILGKFNLHFLLITSRLSTESRLANLRIEMTLSRNLRSHTH